MPLLDADDLDDLRAWRSFCPECRQTTRRNYCRQCDEFFTYNHLRGCMRDTSKEHEGHRQYRPELDPLPERMRALPIDERGYPVPWFVDWIDGKPEFRVIDSRKLKRAIKERLCWVCGQTLGVNLAFVSGPMCGINRVSAEPPSHYDCAKWSAFNCPFLADPSMTRRPVNDLTDKHEHVKEAPGNMLKRNPGVVMVWVTRSYDVIPAHRADDTMGVLLVLGDPTRVEWYTSRRTATRAEVEASVESGLPALIAGTYSQRGGLEMLQRHEKLFRTFLPTE